MSEDDNEEIEFSDQRGLMAKNVREALDDMELFSLASNCSKHLYHISINPNQELNNEHWELAWEVYETEFALQEQPYIEVIHRKEDGRQHKHRVYSRIDIEKSKAVQLSFTKIRNEKIARILEYAFNHPITIGKHNRAIIAQLKKEGLEEIAEWMEQEKAHQKERPVAAASPTDHQQQKRTKIPLEQVKTDLKKAYEQTDNGRAFEAAIAAEGYLMARGDRRDLVIIDEAGGIHSPRRRLGVKAKELKQRWQDLNLDHLPTVEQIKQERDPKRRYQEIAKENKADEAIEKLEQEKKHIEQEIQQLEQQLKTEKETTKHQKEQSISIGQTEQNDQRKLIETFLEISREPERGRRSSGVALSRWKSARFEQAKTVSKSVLRLSGDKAIEERERRLKTAEITPITPPSNQKSSGIFTYLSGLGTMMKEKGREVYRYADRFLAEKLAKNGHTEASIRSILYRLSPELMNQKPSERKSWVWRLVGRVYKQVKHQKVMMEKKKIAPEKNKKMNEKGKEKPADEVTKEPTYSKLELGVAEPADFPFNPMGLLKSLVKKGIKNSAKKLSKSDKKSLPLNQNKPSHTSKSEEKSQVFETRELMSKTRSALQRTLEETKKKENNQASQQQPPEREARQQGPPNQRQQSKPKQEPKPSYKTDKFADNTKEVLKSDNVNKKIEENRENVLNQSGYKTIRFNQESKTPNLKEFQDITEDVLADKKGLSPKPQDSGEQPVAKYRKTSEEFLLNNKEYLQAKVPWLKNEECAKRYHEMCKNYQDLKDKDWHSLESEGRYQKHFMSEEFQERFEQQDYASRDADKWIAKGMIHQTLDTPKSDVEVGQDLLKDHLAIAEKSVHAAQMDDQYGYAAKLIEDVWNEHVEQFQHERKDRSLADVFDAYHEATRVYESPIIQPSGLSPDW